MGSSAVQKRTDDGSGGQREQLGGARADFVANLGRRRAEISGALELLKATPGAARHRDDLRRRLHALLAGARLLRFSALSEELRRVEESLDEAASRGDDITGEEIAAVAEVLGRMTSLAWGQSGAKTTLILGSNAGAVRANEPVADASPLLSALVVGKTSLGEALVLPSEVDGNGALQTQVFEVEQTDQVSAALDLAKALAPDLIVVDADLAGAFELVESLTSETMTDAIPIVVLGRFAKTDDAGRFVALGVARTLPKPASPGEIRRACANVVSAYVKREVVREPIGSVNVDQLGARLAEEMRRGLSDVDQKTREMRVDLGEGTEVLAALWGAVARIRDVMTIKSRGNVRFFAGGPEGAMPLAPWLGGTEGPADGGRAATPRSVRAGSDVSLQKLRVLVADDDPAVTWFLAGVLKAAGASVYEARDGERALEIAKHCDPDLVISDILMPKLDGFALSRALKRDIILRDVPVVLLSWKEDLLQRVRELGADADGYLRKEASAGTIVQRCRELLRQRKRVAERISTDGEIRGRLDGLTTTTLLRFVCSARPQATVSVRDASYLYEIEIRDGRPVRVTRTSAAGSLDRGASVFGALLGVGDGRFVVSPAREDSEVGRVSRELSGTLSEQLAPIIAVARGAQRLLAGANLVRVQRVVVDEERLTAYLSATPEPARRVLRAIADGSSPRMLITSGEVAPRLLEDLLLDLSAHGGVIEIIDLNGVDRLPEATQEELALLRGERAVKPIQSIPVLNLPVMTPFPAPAMEIQMPGAQDLLKVALGRGSVPPPPVAAAPQEPVSHQAGPITTNVYASQMHMIPTSINEEVDDEIPVHEVALDDPWFHDGTASDAKEAPPSSGARQLTPPPPEPRLNLRTPSPRPVVVRDEKIELTPTPSSLPPAPGLKPMLSLGSLHPPPVTVDAEPPKPPKQKTPKPAEVSRRDRNERETPNAPFVDRHAPILPSAYLPRQEKPKTRDRKAIYWVLFALCGVGFAVWARWSREKSIVSEDVLMPNEPAAAEVASEQSTPEPSASEETKKVETATKEKDSPPEDLPLRDYDKVKKGQGMLEVVAGKSDTIYIDGKALGSGPVQSMALKAKNDAYEVKVKMRGEERSRFVNVKEGRLTRVRIAPPWSR